MAQNPETRFINKVNARLPLKHRASSAGARKALGLASNEGIGYEKMANPFTSGTADSWYSGKRDIWVEYKYLARLPVRESTEIHPQKLLRPEQLRWLKERHSEGRTVRVIVGHPKGAIILLPLTPQPEWEYPLTKKDFLAKSKRLDELAEYLLDLIEGHHHER